MRALVTFLLWQELYYGLFIVFICMLIGLDKSFEVGLRSAGYLMLLLQTIIFWTNRKLIKSVLFPEIKDKK